MPIPSLPARTLLLDTHVWIWMVEGAVTELGHAAQNAVMEAGAIGRVLVSAISVWEVGMLEAKGRIRFSIEAGEWVRRALSAPGVHFSPLTPEVALDSTRLPGPVHGDPADRILIATARRVGATLVTRDTKILEYGRQGLLTVIDAAP
jgi:PIN domain nuclease of toxin-antitoxin system